MELKYNNGTEVVILKQGITLGMKGKVVINDSEKDYKISFDGGDFQGYYMEDEIGITEYDYELIPFHEAFDKFIKGKKVLSNVEIVYDYCGDIPYDKKYKGNGISTEDGYMMLHYGGGSRGEDINTEYIVSPDKKLIAKC